MIYPNTGQTDILWDWMAASTIIDDTGLQTEYPLGRQSGLPTINAPNSPYAAGTTPIYRGVVVDPYGVGIPASDFSALTLSIVDVLTGAVILAQTNILNTGRGSIDDEGNLTISLQASDTSLAEAPGVQQLERAMIIDWTYATSGSQASAGTGRHQVNFIVQALVGP